MNWNPDLHPRGRDGKFIEIFGKIRLFDFIDSEGYRVPESPGEVKEISKSDTPGDPDILVELPNGRRATVKSNQIEAGSEVKAKLDDADAPERPRIPVEEVGQRLSSYYLTGGVKDYDGLYQKPIPLADGELVQKGDWIDVNGEKLYMRGVELGRGNEPLIVATKSGPDREMRYVDLFSGDKVYLNPKDLSRGEKPRKNAPPSEKSTQQQQQQGWYRPWETWRYDQGLNSTGSQQAMSDVRVDLYLEWEQALNEPEVDPTLIASLENKARAIGLDLRSVNGFMLNSMTAAIWNPDLHPRGRDGKFIETLGIVRVFDFINGRTGKRETEASGKVRSIKPTSQRGNPDIYVDLDDGTTIRVKPNQIASGPDAKAQLPDREGDRPFRDLSDDELRQKYEETVDAAISDIDPQLAESLGLDAEYLREEFEARGLPRGRAEDRPFRDLSDEELQQAYQNTVDAATSDIDPQLLESLELDVEYFNEEFEARGLPRIPAAPERRPRATGEEGDLEEAFQVGVPTSVRDSYLEYQAAERDRGVQDRDLLSLDDWVESGSPTGGAQAPEQPGPVRERFERTNYVETRDVGNLMVGDEIILPGDMPGVVESFEFPDDRPDSVIVHTDNGSYHGKTGDVLPSFREGDDDLSGPETNPIGEEVTVEPGELGSKDNPIRTADPLEAVTALHEGKYVELETVDQVSTLLDELARIANEAKAAGESAPNYDLCLVSVPNTNLFCAESKGIPRIEMPQLGGIPTPGSRADALPKNDAGEVDIGPAFVRHLREKGVTVEETRTMASHLKASQSELVGTKVGGMMKWMEGGSDLANNTIRESAIFVTRDGYVVDGHHRWAAVVGLDAQEGGLDELDMPVREIDMDILDVLKEANDFAVDFGVPPKGTGAPGAAPGGAI